ncbi:unnamed protein product, partial [Urochloa humidicola]
SFLTSPTAAVEGKERICERGDDTPRVVNRERLAAAMAPPASTSGLFRFLSPRSRPQSTDIAAAATWGVFAGTAGLYLVQPFDWIKKTFFQKPEPEA